MASVTSDLRLPSQLQDITTPWSHTKLYCLTTDTHVCKQLAQNGRGSNPRPMTLSRTSNAPTITPVHTTHDNKIKHMVWVKKSQVSLAIFTQWQKFYTPIVCSYLCKMTTFYSVISWLRQRYAIFKCNHLVSFYTFLEKREKLQYDYKGMTDLMWNAFLSARQCKILIEKNWQKYKMEMAGILKIVKMRSHYDAEQVRNIFHTAEFFRDTSNEGLR